MLEAETNPQNFYKVVNKPDRHVKLFILILFCTFLQALLIYYLKYIKNVISMSFNCWELENYVR